MRGFLAGQFQCQQGILTVLRQITKAHISTPVRLAISRIGAGGVLASLSRTSILRSPRAMVRAPDNWQRAVWQMALTWSELNRMAVFSLLFSDFHRMGGEAARQPWHPAKRRKKPPGCSGDQAASAARITLRCPAAVQKSLQIG